DPVGRDEVGGVVLKDANGNAKGGEDAAVPLGVTFREIVVDGYEVSATPLEGVQIQGQRSDECLAFSGLHFGDLALVENGCAQHLNIEGALSKQAVDTFAHYGEGLRLEVVEVFAGAK